MTVITLQEATDNTIYSSATIKQKLLTCEYKIVKKRGRSTVWEVFGKIQNNEGHEIEGFVACRKCKNVLKHADSGTSNLVKHKCVHGDKKNTEKEINGDEKSKAIKVFTKWTIENCRPLKIVSDSGLREVVKFSIEIGAKYGKDVNVNKLLPSRSSISRNIEVLYEEVFKKIKNEISEIKDIGFGITTDLWTENFLRKTYICVTIHYVLKGNAVNRLIGFRSMDNEKCTSK